MFDLNGTQLDFDPFTDFADAPMRTAIEAEDAPPVAEADDFVGESSTWKGKGVSRPMDIPAAPQADFHDVFDVGSSSTSTSDREYFPFASPLTPALSLTPSSAGVPIPASSLPTPRDTVFSFAGHDVSVEQASTSAGIGGLPASSSSSSKGKGKEKEQPPTLPPLIFAPATFASWPASVAAAAATSPGTAAGIHSPVNLISVPKPPAPAVSTSTAVSRPLLRRRSLPSLASSTTPNSPKSSKFRTKSTLARKLLFRKYDNDSCPTPPSSPTDGVSVDLGAGNCFAPWRNDSVFRLEYDSVVVPGKDRLFPISALDLIHTVASDAFEAVPVEIVNYFDDVLPRELRVHVLMSLVAVHEADHARAIRDGLWTVAKSSSSRNKWVGRDKALRELVRLSRVSKEWQSLVFDGQIWTNLDLRAFPLLPKSLLVRISKSGGAFIREINVAGHVTLTSGTLIEVIDNISAPSPTGALPFTLITSLNLRGCSSITTRSLHHLLIQSRSLERLCLKALGAVTNTTCDIIAMYCSQLITLDLGRCTNIDASGIRNLASAFVQRGEYMPLKELRLAGLKHVEDSTMAMLGRAAPFLEVLDLSYSRRLHNTAMEALVAFRDDVGSEEERRLSALGIEVVTLSAREAGRSVDEGHQFRRRVTRLRHLILSSCILLTDTVCANLAHAVPQLEFLELAGIGSSIEDEGLIRLLDTTPLLRRLDLEDASAITDAVLATLTPALDDDGDVIMASPGSDSEESRLEHLVISGAMEVTDDAVLALIRGCRRLRVLEADSTRVGPAVMRAFVRTVREREVADAKFVAIDCRGFNEALLKELAPQVRPRRGWVAYGARALGFLDARDEQEDELKAGLGQDELDPKRVVVKTFYGWQTVDKVQAAREKRRKARTRRTANESLSVDGDDSPRVGGTRWWSPGARRSAPPVLGMHEGNEGCVIM
ncbi:hypothetical protein MKEN_01256500 [Mycena kentingensis (nom. inval.)]|nr:hypothetical protein MKEN_01256500 [Mycena kentingensis (nom. inval.)]